MDVVVGVKVSETVSIKLCERTYQAWLVVGEYRSRICHMIQPPQASYLGPGGASLPYQWRQTSFVHCHALQFLVLVPTPSRVASYSCDLTSPIYHKDTTASDVTILQSCMHAKVMKFWKKMLLAKTHPCDGCVTFPCQIRNKCVT